jgi:hypothetical protein
MGCRGLLANDRPDAQIGMRWMLSPAEHPGIHAYKKYQENKCGYAQGFDPFLRLCTPPGTSVPVAMVMQAAVMMERLKRSIHLGHWVSRNEGCGTYGICLITSPTAAAMRSAR